MAKKKKYVCLGYSGHTTDIEGVEEVEAKDEDGLYEQMEGPDPLDRNWACFEKNEKNRKKIIKAFKK